MTRDMREEIRLVDLTTETQFRDALALQKSIWAFEDDTDLLPARFFVVAVKVGGQAFGAYSGDKMVAFLLAIPGLKPGGHPYLHSHMLGVLPEYRNSGVGRRLKMRQRDNALARGIDLIEWTFDPLELKNAWFNLEGLGAVIRRYVRNQYGVSSSVLQGGLPTDRCVAEWWIRRERVRPDVIERVRATPVRSQALQEELATRFEACFAKGLTAFGVERTGDSIDYLFGVVSFEGVPE